MTEPLPSFIRLIGSNNYQCKICNVDNLSGASVIQSHIGGRKHKNKAQSYRPSRDEVKRPRRPSDTPSTVSHDVASECPSELEATRHDSPVSSPVSTHVRTSASSVLGTLQKTPSVDRYIIALDEELPCLFCVKCRVRFGERLDDCISHCLSHK
jgi:hypothetical protein